MKITIDTVENLLKKIIESSTYSADAISLKDLLGDIMQFIDQAMMKKITQSKLVVIMVSGNPDNMKSPNPQEFQQLIERMMNELIKDSGESNIAPIRIRLIPNPKLKKGKWRISSDDSSVKADQTVRITPENMPMAQEPDHIVLIIDGDEHVEMNQSVINIGRNDGNQIVLDDLRVSRVHAQIRSVGSQRILFDLNSTIGTSVNSKRISQKKLVHGDLIEIGAHKILFVQENSLPAQTTREKTEKIGNN